MTHFSSFAINLHQSRRLFVSVYQKKLGSLVFHFFQIAACKRGEVFKLGMKGFQGKHCISHRKFKEILNIWFNIRNWLYRFCFQTTYLNISIEIFKYELLRVILYLFSQSQGTLNKLLILSYIVRISFTFYYYNTI